MREDKDKMDWGLLGASLFLSLWVMLVICVMMSWSMAPLFEILTERWTFINWFSLCSSIIMFWLFLTIKIYDDYEKENK